MPVKIHIIKHRGEHNLNSSSKYSVNTLLCSGYSFVINTDLLGKDKEQKPKEKQQKKDNKKEQSKPDAAPAQPPVEKPKKVDYFADVPER